MWLVSWLVDKALGPEKAPRRLLPEVPLTTPYAASVSPPHDFPAAPPTPPAVPRIQPPDRSVVWPAPPAPLADRRPWADRLAVEPTPARPEGRAPLPFGVATYDNTAPGGVVWDPDPWPAPDRIVVGSGRG